MLRPHALLLIAFSLLLLISYLPTQTSTSQATYHSLSLNGSSGHVTVPNGSSINISGPITIEAWIKVNAITGNYQDIVCRESYGQAGTGGGYEFAITSTGKVRLDLYQSHNQYTTVSGSTTVTTGTWHHVAGVFDGNQMRVYLNGVLDGSLSTTNGPASGTSPLNIGKSTYTTYYFGGLIDQARISAAALYSSNFTPGLGPANQTRAFWKFDGQTANDVSGNGNHGTLQSGASYSTDVPSGTNNAPAVTLTHPQNNTSIASGSTVMIDATATDGDGVVTKVDFYQGTTLLGSDTSAPYTFAWNNVSGGVYSITAKATDDNGAVTTSSAITVNVLNSLTFHSLSLNGTSGYVTVPNSSSINISGPITIEAWIKVNAITGNYQDIVCRESYGQAGTGGGYEFAITSTGKVRLDLYQSHNQYTTVSGSTTVTTGTWHHVAGVFDGNQMRVYLNGVLDGSISTTNGPASGTSPLNIGKSTYTTYYFGGLIDEVRISAAALYSSNFTPGLGPANQTRAFWKFDGQTANDSSGNGNHGTLQSGATYSTTVPPQSGGQRPIPVANGPYNGLTAQAVQFSSSGSFDPDGTISSYHWNFGDGTSTNTANPSHTYAAPGLYTATLTITDNAGLLASATASVNIAGSSNTRVDPVNQTGGGGENPLSRNFNWSLPLVNLPGRAGLDLGLTLSYNSLVWTKTGNFVSFDDDQGSPSPGFRLGFPVIQPLYYNQEVGKYAYLLIGSDGSRTELRQVGASALFESADSAHILLDTSQSLPAPDNDKFILRTTDGTQLFYASKGLNYQCTRVKDRNGNYISINYNLSNQIDTVVDTLNRTVKFNYDPNGWLLSITQIWKQGTANETTHTYASFAYTDVTFQTSFTNLTVVGASNGTTRKMLSKITLDDNSPTPSNNSRFEFAYTSWGQVWKISNFAADNRLLNYRSYNLSGWNNPPNPEAQADCPRFTERRDWAENWNRSGTPASGYMLPTGAEQEVVTTFTPAQPGTATVPGQSPQTAAVVQVTNPDLSFTKIYFLGTSGTDSGWKVGLPYLVESYDVGGSIPQRQAVTNWTQDDETSLFVINPRVLETNVHDPAGNRKRTEIVYHQYVLGNGMTCQLPEDIREYDANASSVLRTTRTIYEENAVYLSRRIIGLPKQRSVYAGLAQSGTLQSKVEFIYDQTAIEGTTDPAAIQHDNVNFAVSFLLGRGNLTSVRRYDMDAPTQFNTTATNKYNRVGLLVASKDADDHEVTVSYADSFASNGTATDSNPQDAARLFTTLAYQTTITDADGNSTKLRYNYDFGALTWQQTPQPNLTTYTPGPIQTFTFDVIGRLARTTSLTDNAFTRYNYGLNYIETFSSVNTVVETANEGHSLRVFDGHGRVIATASGHPNTTPSRQAPVGDFSAQLVLYDRMGRVQKRSNPTETSISIGGTPINPSQFSPLGDDAIANWGFGWKYVQQTYDWKGRPLVTTNQDGTTKTAAYTGCGCAGGEVVTLTDEGTGVAPNIKQRQQKIHSDVLGRVWKTEILNWDGPGPNGTGGSVYSATVNTYNARDQITQVRKYAGVEGSGTYQDTAMTYDGYGRLKTKRVPEQNPGTATTWDYNADDTIQKVTDARGASQTFAYNDRHLTTGITYAVPGGSGISVPASVDFAYDAAGNRTQMTDGLGSVTYTRDNLSRLTAETRNFTGLGSFTISYAYNLAGHLTSVTDPFGALVGYTHDAVGRVTAVSGSNFASVSTYASSMQYRAWGGLKSLTYGNSKTLALTYDAKLNASTYEVPGVMKKGYQYYNDGRLKFTQDQLTTNSKFDRLYRYNHLGRVTIGLSGLEAREQGTTDDRPYNETMTYDTFGHLTSRDVRQWDRHDLTLDSYVNNRRVGWNYDADGRVLGGSNTFTYDAAGHITSFGFADPHQTDQQFDGDGQRAKTVFKTYDTDTGQLLSQKINYYVHSTVLGSVLSEVSATGVKERSFVFASGGVLAIQSVSGSTQHVQWQHYDVSGGSYRATDPTGVTGSRAERDPFGADAGIFKPITWPPPSDSGKIEPFYGVPELNSATQGCVLDRVPVPCDILNALMEAGGVEQEYLIPADQKSESTKPVRGAKPPPPEVTLQVVKEPVVPFGMGLFGVGIPRWINDNEGGGQGWDNFFFYFGPPKPGIEWLPIGGSYGDKGKLDLFKIIGMLETNERCRRAFEIVGLQSINDTLEKGVVIGPSTLLNNSANNELMGITEGARRIYNDEFGTSSARGATIRNVPGQPNPFRNPRDQRPRMFFSPFAFGSFSGTWEDVVHEFIHAGGQGKATSWWPGSHDLSGYEWYGFIQESCKPK